MANEGSAGLLGKAELAGEMDFSSSATSSAQGGKITNYPIFNSLGNKFGLVKMLALSAFAILALKIIRTK